jgi:hypothetical protein
MIAYQVNLNGKPVATAGLTHGVISAIANWVFIPSDVAKDPESDWHASFSLGGLDDKSSDHLHWFRTDLKVGDEITLKLVEVTECDTPTEPLLSKSKEEVKRILHEEYQQTQQAEQ